jgi:hypothetical protein
MSDYQPGICQTARWSDLFQFVSSDSGFTSAVSTVTASSNSSRCKSCLCDHIREARLCDHIREARPCDKLLLVAAPAVHPWSCGIWVGWMMGCVMTEVLSLSWDGKEGCKAVVPGCEENIKPTNWSLGLPAQVGGTVIISIEISTEFWRMKLIICHVLYCCNSLHSSHTQVCALFVYQNKIYMML